MAHGTLVWTTDTGPYAIGHFRSSWGRDFTLPLGVPLCTGCDGAVMDGWCASCEEPAGEVPAYAIRPREHDETACPCPRRLAPVRSLIATPEALTDAVYAMAGGRG